MCGEKKVMRGAKDKRMGSPPHVRGKVRLALPYFLFTGITPACAGKRCKAGNQNHDAEDHPRMCGEKTKKIP